MPSFLITYQYREISAKNPIKGSVSYRASHISQAIDIAVAQLKADAADCDEMIAESIVILSATERKAA